jgi:hypothetical protein
MARNSNIIKYAMQLRNDIVDLSGQVTRVDCHWDCEPQIWGRDSGTLDRLSEMRARLHYASSAL